MLVAINENIINKASSAVLSENNGTYTNVDLTPEQFAEQIKLGYAFCAQHKNGWRKTDNFTVSGILAIDIDDGLSVQDALDDDYVQNYACIIYTTPSHTEEFPRFRIVFELVVPITDALKMRHALTGLINRFGGDGACTDACHMFYGSTISDPILMGKTLPEQQVDELVARAMEESKAFMYKGGKNVKTNIRSILTLEKNAEIKLESDELMKLADIPVRTRVYCPKHVDRKASAFTLRSTQGNPGIYCSTCETTYFLKTSSAVHDYNFDYSWYRVLTFSPEEQQDAMYSEDESKVLCLNELRGGHIREVNSRYLKYDEPAITTEGKYLVPEIIESDARLHQPNPDVGNLRSSYRLTFVKSPKGTGKTDWLRDLVSAHKSKNVSILLVGHRRSLISTSAKRLGLVSYLEDPSDKASSRTKYNPVQQHYAICADSLANMVDTRINRYDLILIDEVEQVFSHLLADTMKEKRREILHTLRFYLNKAKAIYLLDADLNRTTVEIIDSMLTGEVQWQAIVNTWTPENKTVHLYQSKNHLVGELEASLKRGERCFVSSNSKKKIIGMNKALSEKFGENKKFCIITGDNSDTAEVQHLIKNIKTAILEYDAIFVSPAMGTGIDITFDMDGQLIDSVFGIFEARINTHFDIDQQLARVRNPKRVCVWISSEKFNYETDANAIEAELQSSDTEHRSFIGIDDDGNREYRRDELYESVFSNVIAMERASKNKLLENFCDLKHHNGWIIVDVEKDKALHIEGKGVLDSGKKIYAQELMDGILGAEPIGPNQYRHLRKRNKNILSAADIFKMRRYELEAFYCDELSQEMVALDNDGKFRKCVREFQLLYLSDEELRKRAEFDKDGLTDDRDSSAQRKQLYLALFSAAGLMADENKFDISKVIEKGDLAEFIQECQSKKVVIERVLEVQVRKDIRFNPTQQLGMILKNLGLNISRVSYRVIDGSKLYSYRLDAEGLASLQAVHDWRADDNRRNSWTKKLEERDDDFVESKPALIIR